MRFQPGFTDVFISPVTGRFTLSGLPLLPEDYVWLGDRDNRPVPSPVIIDIKLEIIELNSRLAETRFILQTGSEGFYNSQALDQLRDGILRHESGVVKIATLPEKNIWIGDPQENPVPYPRIFLDNLPSMHSSDPSLLQGAYNLYTGDSDSSNLGNPIIVKTLNITNLPDLTVGYFWMGANSTSPGNFGSNRPVETQFLPIGNMPDLQYTWLWLGDISNRPIAVPHIEINNLPDLSFRKIWRGDITGRPIESDSLSNLETTVAGILFDLGALQLQVDVLETTVAGLVLEVASIQGQLLLIGSILSGIAVTLTSLQTQIDNTNTRIDNLRLNNIPIDGDIDMHGYRITNLPCDPIYDLEPTTLCFIWHLMHDEVEVLWP